MRFDNLILWLKNPEQLDRDSLLQLKALLDEYPCFTVARILYLKNLLALNDLRFSKELILTAMSVPDRKRLYYFIEGKTLPESPYTQENELESGEGFSIIDRFLNLAETKDKTIEKPLVEKTPDTEMTPDIPQESVIPQESNFSLDYASYLTQADSTDEDSALTMPGQDLIDAFLKNDTDSEPYMPRLKKESSEDLKETDQNSFIEDLSEDTFTETLAKIYLKQKRYDRALEIFKTLSLKYPEKNVYFADQIRFLEKLIQNIKNN